MQEGGTTINLVVFLKTYCSLVFINKITLLKIKLQTQPTWRPNNMTQEEAAGRVGKSRSAVANSLRLLDLDAAVQKLLGEGKLSAGHARALVPLSPALQIQAANAIIAGGLSVRQTEALAKRLAAEKKPEKEPANKKLKKNSEITEDDQKKAEKDPPTDMVDYTAEAQKALASQLGRGVKIVTGRKKGRIELEYYGMDDLNDLLEALALLRVRKAQKGQGK